MSSLRGEREVATYLKKARRGKVRWKVLDADGSVLGRLAVRAARVLTGKSSPDFTPHVEPREGVIIINAEKVSLTGRKLDQKFYRRHTGYPGGLREFSARQLMSTRPEQVVREAILGMLPKTRLGDRMARRLRVYAGPVHPHVGQMPQPLSSSR